MMPIRFPSMGEIIFLFVVVAGFGAFVGGLIVWLLK